VTAQSAYTKNKKLAVIDLKPETAAELKTYLQGKMPQVRAFAMPYSPSRMTKKDIKAAGIDYKTEQGQRTFTRCDILISVALHGWAFTHRMPWCWHGTVQLP